MEEPIPKAVLVGVMTPQVDEASFRAGLTELARLCKTLGLQVVGEVTQRRGHLDMNVLGAGKLRELSRWTGGRGVVPKGPPKQRREAEKAAAAAEAEAAPEVPEAEEGEAPPEEPVRATHVIVDHELTPSQVRNLAGATGAQVLDRAAVIVEIFHRHASSKEARLQVEIARLAYLSPRIRESGGDRVRGGVGAKGAGETALELDRRRVRDRIAVLRRELSEIEDGRSARRARRRDAQTVALVGYTNAGKSSLMRALTGSDVMIADKLFATLDTTVRTLWPPATPPVLVTDTVGFIQKLPHDLVASFRSTLDAALEASLLLYVVDAADPAHVQQLRVTREVLGEIGAGDVPSIVVFNKTDRLEAAEIATLLESEPGSVATAAVDPDAVARLRDLLVAHFASQQPEVAFVVPWHRQALIGQIRAAATVIEEAFTDDGISYTVRAPQAVLDRLLTTLTET